MVCEGFVRSLLFLSDCVEGNPVARRSLAQRAVALLWLLPAAVTAQQIGGFDRIGLEHGLSQSTVYAIVKDRLGFLWFGTQDGLNRFDGYTMTVFKHNAADSNSLSDNVVWSLLSDRDGNVWIGTERGGLNKFVSHEKRFYHFRSKKDDPTTLSDDFVTALFQDTDGNLWVGTQGNGLNLYDAEAGRFIRFLHERADMTSIAGNAIRAIAQDHRHRLWIATSNGVSRLDLASVRTRSDRPAIFEDADGEFWIGTYGEGLNHLDVRRVRIATYRAQPANRYGLSNDRVTAICQSKDGSVWIATNGGGLNRYSKRTKHFQRFVANARSDQAPRFNQISTLCYDAKHNTLFLGYFNGGVSGVDLSTHAWTHYTSTDAAGDPLWGSPITALLSDDPG